ncbi:Protein of unknown function, partial [Cotesia congregata]
SWTSLLPGVGLGQKFGLGTLARNRSSGFGRLLVEEPDLVEVKELDNEPARGFWLRKAETPALSLGCWHLTFRVLGQHAAASGPGLTGCFSDAARIDLTEPAPSSLSAPEAASSRARTSHLVEGSVGERTGSRSERKEIQEDYFLQDNNCTRRNDRRRRRACGRSTLASWNERRQRRRGDASVPCHVLMRLEHPPRTTGPPPPTTIKTKSLHNLAINSINNTIDIKNSNLPSKRPSPVSTSVRRIIRSSSSSLYSKRHAGHAGHAGHPESEANALVEDSVDEDPGDDDNEPAGKEENNPDNSPSYCSSQNSGYEERGTLMQQHPYNEYTWDVNAINPWLSACDLAGPAPADLQGTCGPPEVPKYCPMPCKGQGDAKKIFLEAENRYWFVSGLRLRHCCEHAAVNALAPGKGGPLEDVLNGGRKCVNALDKLLSVDALAARLHCEFGEVLARYDCAQQYSVIHNCTHCKK